MASLYNGMDECFPFSYSNIQSLIQGLQIIDFGSFCFCISVFSKTNFEIYYFGIVPDFNRWSPGSNSTGNIKVSVGDLLITPAYFIDYFSYKIERPHLFVMCMSGKL